MIAVTVSTSYNYKTEYLAVSEIARISEVGPHSGTFRSVVRMKDGGVLECQETAQEIAQMVQQELQAAIAARADLEAEVQRLREALLYAVKQVPELGTVPGIAAALKEQP